MTKKDKLKKRSQSYINKNTKPLTVEQRMKTSATLEDGVDLGLLQDRIKRQPDLYRNEFVKHFNIMKAKLTEFKETPGKHNESLCNYMKFISHISSVYKKDIVEYLSSELLNMLQQYYSILNPAMRLTMVTCLRILRGKDLVQPTVVLPVFFKLFKCQDKELRSFLHGTIISDIKKLNIKHKNHGVNRKLQNFIFEMIQDANETASKRSLVVMIELYKRKIWNDEKTVNVIATACLSDNPKICASACKFFLTLELNYESESEGEDSDEEDKKLLAKSYKGTKKMTKGRIAKVEKALKQHKRKESRKSKVKISTDFLPIDLIYDAQAFTEKLFNKLRKSNDRYEVKLLMMRLISRMIGRHQLLLLPFYPHLLRYLTTHQKDKVAEIFAMIVESCHELVPPEEIKPVVEKIISNFITEFCANQHITIGLNAVREILTRMPLALDESQIEYLCQFRSFKNSSVVNAARSLVNFFRDVCPELLPKKMRGRFTQVDEDNKKENLIYGQQKINFDIDGVELLRKYEKLPEGTNMAAERILDDNDLKKIRYLKMRKGVRKVDRKGFASSDDEAEIRAEAEENSEDEEVSFDEEDGVEEEQDSDDNGEEIDDDGEEVEDSEEDEDEWEEIPQLVPIKGEGEDESEPMDEEGSQTDLENINSSEFDMSEEEANPHGFVYAQQLDTFKKTKKERLIDFRSTFDKEAHRDKFKKEQNTKKGGKSNKEKINNKPFMMRKQKVLYSIKDKYQCTKKNIKDMKAHLGKFKKHQKQRIEKRRRLK